MQPGGKYVSRKLPKFTLAEELSASLEPTEDCVNGQKWCSRKAAAASPQTTMPRRARTSLFLGLRENFGVMTETILVSWCTFRSFEEFDSLIGGAFARSHARTLMKDLGTPTSEAP